MNEDIVLEDAVPMRPEDEVVLVLDDGIPHQEVAPGVGIPDVRALDSTVDWDQYPERPFDEAVRRLPDGSVAP